MKKKLFFLTLALVLVSISSCKNDPIENLSLKEIFESLPAAVMTTETNMKVKNVSPGDGPDYQVLLFNDVELIQSSKIDFKIIASDLAFGEGPSGSLYIANKNLLNVAEASDLIPGNNFPNFHSYQIRANKSDAYIKGELWNEDGTLMLKEFYFRYSLGTNILTNENGTEVAFNNH